MTSSSSSSASDQQGFVRGMGLMDAILLVAGIMIGAGIFIGPPEIARLVGAPGWTLVVWLIAGLMTLMATLSYGELAALMPQAGGQYIYLKETYGKITGFLYGWTLFLVIQTGTIAAVAIGFAKYLGVLFPGIHDANYLIPPLHLGSNYALCVSTEQFVAMAVILLLAWLNTRGLEAGKAVQNIFTVAKLGALGLLIVLGWLLGANAPAIASNFGNAWQVSGDLQTVGQGLNALTSSGLFAAAIVALPIALFSSDGWYSLTFIASELKNPERNLPKALGYGTILVVGVYLLTNLTYLAVLPFSAVQTVAGDRVAAATADAIFPGVGSIAIAIAIMISTFGCVNGLSLAGSRAYYAMSHDGLFFHRAGQLNRNHVPAWGLWIQGLWAAFLVLPRVIVCGENGCIDYGPLYSTLVTYTISSALLFYILTILAIMVLRRRWPERPRPYKAIGYPYMQWVYIILAAIMLAGLFYLMPAATLPGLAITASGLPVYWLWRRLEKPFALPPESK
jgi:APA family basic amino acid/polyamine antiporter